MKKTVKLVLIGAIIGLIILTALVKLFPAVAELVSTPVFLTYPITSGILIVAGIAAVIWGDGWKKGMLYAAVIAASMWFYYAYPNFWGSVVNWIIPNSAWLCLAGVAIIVLILIEDNWPRKRRAKQLH